MLKRGEAIELRYPAGLEVDRVVLLSLGKTEGRDPASISRRPAAALRPS